MFRSTHLFLFTILSGKKLSDLERVTSLKVYNWFANRRKEIKRRANIGKVEALVERGVWGVFEEIGVSLNRESKSRARGANV